MIEETARVVALEDDFAWLRHYAKKIVKDPRYQPVVLRRAGMH